MLTRSRLIMVLTIMVVTIMACTSSISVVTVQPPSDQVATTTPATLQNNLQSSETQDPTNQFTNSAPSLETKLAQATMLALTPTQTPQPVATWLPDPSFGVIEWNETIPLPNPASAPFDSLRGQQLIFHEGYVYIFGGRNGSNGRLRKVYFSPIRLNGNLWGWTETTPLPGSYHDHVVVTIGDYLYLLTGAAGSDDVYYAPINEDRSIGAWRMTVPLSPSRQTFAAASYGNFIYTTGGNSGGIQSFVHYTSVKPDGSLNPWMYTTSLPAAVQEHTMLAYDNYLYVVGGKNAKNDSVVTVFFSAIQPDGSLGAWEQTASLPRKVPGFGTFESNGYIYLLGGGSSFYTRVLEDHTLGKWTTLSSLPDMRNGLWVGANNGFAYAFGGFDGTAHQSTTYYGWLGLQTSAEDTPASDTDCTSGWTQLRAGREAKVSEGHLPNRVHVRPGKSEPTVALLYPGVIVNVIEGPVCADGAVFWKVESSPEGAGWTAEGEGRKYFMEPIR